MRGCENIAIALDSPDLHDFLRDAILKVVPKVTKDMWASLLD
jgi:hypothetical protein